MELALGRMGGAQDEIRKELDMDHIEITGLPFDASRIGLGTWAIGGWLWGGTEESDAISTIHAALDNGINLIDTAPVYGFGRSEELVGKALQGGRRAGAIIATKAIHELQRINGRYALVTMCIGGGQGIAAIFERA